MILKEFLDTLMKLDMDFGDMMFEYEDSKLEKIYYQLLDDDDADLFYYFILENHLDEIEYLYSRVTYDGLIITIDHDSVMKVIKDYHYDIDLDI